MIFIKYTVNNNSRQQITIYILRQIFEYSEYCKSSTFLSKKYSIEKKICGMHLMTIKRPDLQYYEILLRRATNMRNAGCGFVDY